MDISDVSTPDIGFYRIRFKVIKTKGHCLIMPCSMLVQRSNRKVFIKGPQEILSRGIEFVYLNKSYLQLLSKKANLKLHKPRSPIFSVYTGCLSAVRGITCIAAVF